ncbi:type III pantothenate kinase [Hymenobacter guriensis]|uniref:Type III pantothenate kinase n=1 Tax=Hymenobacter guriensis TaxID=2793065 RepID=A0ABS0L589_9BACT|nr:type III pantothenate kinase [Hymenobacter guriensis]MBG8554522.1 type III pantothenate kinase [Hymenobacter guriensis]
MCYLTLDIGNTSSKLGCFVDGELVEQAAGLTVEQVLAAAARLQPRHTIVATVAAQPVQDWVARLQPFTQGVVVGLDPAATPVPLHNGYATPHTLGADRLAAAVGAAARFPGQNVLIVDAGTAIKCDLVEAGPTFRGGSIAPGLRLRFQALHTFTGRLPLLAVPADVQAPVSLTGNDTHSAIASGVLNGAAAEVNGLIAEYRELYPELAVVLTGGDAPFFEPRLKGRIFVVPELILLGLHRIQVHNVN